MKNKIVSFEIAKLAFLKGYNIGKKGTDVWMYRIDGELSYEKLGYQHCRVGDEDKFCLKSPKNNDLKEGFILAPTQNSLIKWLNKEYQLDVLDLGFKNALKSI